jgi:hypothetical protein
MASVSGRYNMTFFCLSVVSVEILQLKIVGDIEKNNFKIFKERIEKKEQLNYRQNTHN